MTAPTPPVDGVTRRSVLTLSARGVVGAGLVLSVSACGLRLDRPPPTPPVPTRRPAPDEKLLLSVIADLAQLVTAEQTIASDGAAGGASLSQPIRSTLSGLLRLHREQVTVLTGRLTNDGVPLASITSAPTTGPLPRTVDELAAGLASLDGSDWAAVAGATPPTRELLTAAYSLRLAGAVELARDVAVPSPPSPVREALLARTRPLVYAFEVVAAQSTKAQRTRAVATLRALTRLEEELAAGGRTAPTAWSLPFPVTTAAAADRLATRVMSSAVAALVDVVGPSPSAATLRDGATWSARVQSLAVDWSVPLTAFPGTDE